MQEVCIAQPASVEEFKMIVEEFAVPQQQPAEIRRDLAPEPDISKWSLFRVTVKLT